MKNEDELMIALDIIKTYSEAAQLNGKQLKDSIAKIDNVKSELLKASESQAKSTIQNELALPLQEFNQNADKFWAQGAYLVNELKKQSEKNRWRNGFILGVAMIMLFGSMILGIFIWLPSLDEIKQRRASIEYLTPKVEELRVKYNAEFQKCDGKVCVRIEPKECYANKGSNIYNLCVLKIRKD